MNRVPPVLADDGAPADEFSDRQPPPIGARFCSAWHARGGPGYLSVDAALRHFLVVGAMAVVRYNRRKATALNAWANQLLECKPARLVTVVLANKVARIVWAVVTREETYRPGPVAA